MKEEIAIAVTLTPTHWKERFPGARVYINEQLIFEEILTEEKTITWQGTIQEQNKIIVEMYNKQDGDTTKDSDGNIANDVLLNIQNISIDEIELGQLLWTKSIYYPDPSNTSAPSHMKECVNLGWNGRWELEFDSPVYLWLLENF